MSLHIRPNDMINRTDDLKHPRNQKRPIDETKVHSKNEKTDMTIKTLKNKKRTKRYIATAKKS